MITSHLVVLSFASSLYKIAEKSTVFLKKLFFSISFVFGIARTIVVIFAIVNYDDPDNEDNDYGWNVCISVFMLLTAAEIQFITYSITYFGFQIISAIETLIEKTPDNPNHVIAKQYVGKAKSYLRNYLPLTFPTTLGYGILPIIFLSTGNATYSYVCLFVIFDSHPQAVILSVALAIPKSK